MSRQDLWDTCYEGEHRKIASPDQFAQMFCSRCQNSGCSRSQGSRTKWQHRMDTQEELLLRNPRFAEDDDPRFLEIREQEFQDAVRQALAIEVSNSKGDWSIPTDTEIATMAASVVGFVPPIQDQVRPAPQLPDPPTSRGSEDGEWLVRSGDKKSSYTVKKTGDEWSCTCSGFVHRRSCKHIDDLRLKHARTAPASNEATSAGTEPIMGDGVRRMPDTSAWAQAMFQGKIPKSMNTVTPSGGVYVGGAEPQPDPWAAPNQTAEPILPVGGRVVLGKNTGNT